MRIVSVGVPARNEQPVIGQTLNDLLDQRLPSGVELEVIVCANCCTDQTAQVVASLAKVDSRVRLLETAIPGKSNALNLIKLEATGAELFFCDADVRPEPSAVTKLLQVLDARPDLAAVGVKTLPLERPNRNWVEAVAGTWRKTHDARNLIGAFFAIRKARLPEFPLDVINEDTWLSYTLGRDNYVLIPGVEVRQTMARTLGTFLGQVTRWDAGRMQLYQWGVAELPNPLMRFRARFAYFGELSWRERLVLPLLLPIALWARLASAQAHRSHAFEHGWEPKNRSAA